jgi:hypothetical protein
MPEPRERPESSSLRAAYIDLVLGPQKLSPRVKKVKIETNVDCKISLTTDDARSSYIGRNLI